jgi:hypothetical protein
VADFAVPVSCPECAVSYSLLLRYGGEWRCSSCLVAAVIATDASPMRTLLSLLADRHICAYCGEAATDVEHVIAKMWSLPTWTVRACSECNRLAGKKLFVTFADKRAFIRQRLARRYWKALHQAEWTADEIEEMGYNLRGQIRARSHMGEWVRARLAFDVAIEALVHGSIHGETAKQRQARRKVRGVREAVSVGEGGPEILQPEMQEQAMVQGEETVSDLHPLR